MMSSAEQYRLAARCSGHFLLPMLLALSVVVAAGLLVVLVAFPGFFGGALQNYKNSALESSSQANIGPGVHRELIKTSLYNLQADFYAPNLPEFVAEGGAIALFGPNYLVVDGDGRMHSFGWIPDSNELWVKPLPYQVPLNGEALDHANISGLRREWFRVLDVLVLEEAGTATLFVSHHVWKPAEGCFAIRVSVLQGDQRAMLSGSVTAPWATLFETTPCLAPKDLGHVFMGQESGGRLALLQPGTLMLTLGDLQFDGILADQMYAQDPTALYGKSLLINIADGSSRVYTLGHRNPQGLYIAPDGRIWSTEHGPQGGDELNLLKDGSNYGWPLVTYGTQYHTKTWPLNKTQGRHDEYEPPVYSWIPSIGVSNVIGIEKTLFPFWQGDLLVSSLRAQSLFRVRLDDGPRAVIVEAMPVFGRVRDLLEGHDGRIIIWFGNQKFALLQPADDTHDGQLAFEIACAGCHSNRERELYGVGPRLPGILNRAIAAQPNYPYSPAMEKLGGTWDAARLDEFLKDPAAYVPGTSMQAEGISDPERRAAIIEYLKSLRQRP